MRLRHYVIRNPHFRKGSFEETSNTATTSNNRVIRRIVKAGFPETEQFVQECKDSGKFNNNQIAELESCLKYDYTLDEFKLFAKPEFNVEQMKTISVCISYDEFSKEFIEALSNPKFDAATMESFLNDVSDGIKPDDVLLYMNPAFSKEQREIIKEAIQDASMFGKNKDLYNKYIKEIVNPSLSAEEMKEVKEKYKEAAEEDWKNTFLDNIVLIEFKDVLKKCNSYQKQEIYDGYYKKLSNDKIALYADSELSPERMEQIKLGLINGLTKKQVSLYANRYFSVEQMKILRASLEEGLAFEKVKLYAYPDITPAYMLEIMEKFEKGKSAEEVKKQFRL
jgi:hypothetical protein